MAGSFVSIPPEDFVLAARVEGLTLLANQLSEPVVIFDPSLRLVYANTHADSLVSSCPLLNDSSSIDLDASSRSQESCTVCPAKDLLTGMETQNSSNPEPSIINMGNPSCPFPTSFTVPGARDNLACVVLMGRSPEGNQVLKTSLENITSTQDIPISQENQFVHPLIGQSASMQQLLDMIGLVAQSESTVMIEGESGTGKELVAKTIHQMSSRRDHPFVVVECSSLPETLLESELFGHVRGAFTGAVADRKGLFEEAEGGTIFLDEIADTSPTFQAKLLRVLQEGEIKPVGSNRNITVDVRVISASNKPLASLVQERAFRTDLYYRLAVLPLAIPALRDRSGDIPLLVKYFLEKSCMQNSKVGRLIPPETMHALVAHDWPGNVRELENVIERAVVVGQHSTLKIQDFFGARPDVSEVRDFSSLSKAARQAVEKKEILKALQETRGDKSRAARKLKISRANLYNKLKEFQIQ